MSTIEKETIMFPSTDGLTITADLYEVSNPKLTILLCHQAGFSRGEYINSVNRLNVLGYTCLAIDQRSGEGVNGVENETAAIAKKNGLSTNYVDAKGDIESAIDFLYKRNNNQPILIVGSSYSASWVLVLGKENYKVKAVAAFSPGEYLEGINVTQSIAGYNKPIFVTSSKGETPKTEELLVKITSSILTHYKTNEEGIHGSRALWTSTPGSNAYWNSFLNFLEENED